MAVVATAGHVDHGKSTLVRALTGIEPDRWAQERARGLTIDLGFAWMRLPSGREVSFVDVPGHERFVGNMLAGLGPAPVVCFVVAVDQGWSAQSDEHRDAVRALGIDTGVVVLSRTDLAPDRVGAVRGQVRTELAGTGLARAPVVPVSALTGAGLQDLITTLDEVLAGAPRGDPAAPLRLWVDRAFTVAGAGLVVTGTLAQGTLAARDHLELSTAAASRRVTVRGLQTHHRHVGRILPVSRAAVNLRGTGEDVARGDVLLTPGAWIHTQVVDVARTSGLALTDAPRNISVHLGTAAVPAHLRALDEHHARLRLRRTLPLRVGDRAILRGSAPHVVAGGVVVLDVDPPPLTRRGAGRERGRALARLGHRQGTEHLVGDVGRRGAAPIGQLERMGLDVPATLPPELDRHGQWIVDRAALQDWAGRLRAAAERHLADDPLSPGLTDGAAIDLLGLPDAGLLPIVVRAAGLHQHAGRVGVPAPRTDLGAAEQALHALEQRLRDHPFRAPEASDLAELGLGARELAAAERHGRLLRLDTTVVVLPSAPARAMAILSRLDQPFTASAARQALGTTRRTAIPLLEHLDARGWTRPVAHGQRIVVR